MPEGKKIEYVPPDNPFMREAEAFARENSLDEAQPTGSVIVKDGQIIGRGANGSEFHLSNPCERVRLGIPTGERYDLCEGCHPKNHSEPKAIKSASLSGHDLQGADIYLWGHWWLCKPCWDAIEEADLAHVYLMEGSENIFNKKLHERQES